MQSTLANDLRFWGQCVTRRWAICLFGVLFAIPAMFVAPATGEEANAAVATVNGQAVEARDVELELLISGLRMPTDADREAALQRVIDRQLILRSIATKTRGPDPLEADIEDLVEYIRRGIESGGESVEAVLGRLNLTNDDVRRAATGSVHWQAHVRRTVTEQQLRELFDARREEFDGTRVHVRQIVRTVPSNSTPAEKQVAIDLLNDLHKKIAAGMLDFAEAAMKYSQSPSGQKGGDVGLIRFRGDLSAEISAAAFRLQVNEISSPVESPNGVHLIQVLERLPGDLSLEDARPALLQEIEKTLWAERAATLRRTAKIVRPSK